LATTPSCWPRKKLQAPKSWADLLKPEYKGEVQMANPASSGTAYTMIATLVQIMGEDKAFDYLKSLHKNISTYTRSGTAPIKAAARGETMVSISFVHDVTTEAIRAFPCGFDHAFRGHRRRNRLHEHRQGRAQLEAAKKFYEWALTPGAQQFGAGRQAVPAAQQFGQGRPAHARSFKKIKLINYDYAKYGASAERRRLIAKWEKEVNSLPALSRRGTA
jgi:iron(III) transport system substrate-binding protein